MAPKDKEEVTEMKRAALLCTQALEKSLLAKIEDVVDNGSKISHAKLAQNGEAAVLDPAKALDVKVKSENVQIAHPFVVQSGGKYDLKVGASVDDERLHYDPLGAPYSAPLTGAALQRSNCLHAPGLRVRSSLNGGGVS